MLWSGGVMAEGHLPHPASGKNSHHVPTKSLHKGHGSPDHPSPSHPGHHDSHHNFHYAAGFKIGDTALFVPGKETVAFSNVLDMAVFFEVSIVPHKVELEIEFKGLWESHGFALSTEVLIKLPFAIHKQVDLYFGTGPELSFLLTWDPHANDHHDKPSNLDKQQHTAPSLLGLGWTGVVGFNWWVTTQMGIEMEVNYTWVWDLQVSSHVHEIGLNAGVIVRW
jgi:hypothetical protein